MAAAAAIAGHLVDVRELELMEPVTVVTRDGGRARPRQRRHRPDHPEAVPEADRALRASGSSCSGTGARSPTSRSTGRSSPGAPILACGRNFGSGSSREHAPWALEDAGYRAIVAPCFGDIFRTNCVEDRAARVVLPEADVRELLDAAPAEATVDLERLVVTMPSGREVAFDIDADVRNRLLNGWDDIALTLLRGERSPPTSASASVQARAPSRFKARSPEAELFAEPGTSGAWHLLDSRTMGHAFASIDELGSGYGFRKVRAPLGITAFGVNAVVMPPGFDGFMHYHERQDELYIVHSGTARFEVDGEVRELGPGGLCHVSATTPRKVSNPGSDDLVLVIVGGQDGYVERDGHLVDPADAPRRAAFSATPPPTPESP